VGGGDEANGETRTVEKTGKELDLQRKDVMVPPGDVQQQNNCGVSSSGELGATIGAKRSSDKKKKKPTGGQDPGFVNEKLLNSQAPERGGGGNPLTGWATGKEAPFADAFS